MALLTEMPAQAKSKRVFVVHGRNKEALNEVELFLHQLKLEPLVLHKQPNKGRSILYQVPRGCRRCIVRGGAMMPEDEGGLSGEPLKKRARQNVVFELGFFIGKLGSENVCALMGHGVEKPSDFDGIAYVQFGDSTNWKSRVGERADTRGSAA